MRKLTLRSLWSHKRRFVATISAVMLGVGFTAGILVFTDTLNRAFDDLFASATGHIDTVVQGEVVFGDQFGGDQRANLDASLVDTVRDVDGVSAAEPYVLLATYSAQVLDRDGHAIGSTNGPPTLVESWGDPDADLNPYNLTDGSRAPTADGEIAINVGAAEDGGYSIGDTVTMVTQDGREEFELVGTFLFGTAKSSGGAVSADFNLAEAQRLAGTGDQISQVLAVADENVTDTELTSRIQAAIGDRGEALTGAAFGEQTAESIEEGFGFFAQILGAFATIALLVGIFIIYNTFQILVAQRTRELALLRAVGATKGQVVRSVLLEALVIGVVASAAGVALGIVLAFAVTSAFSGASDLPTSGLLITPATVISCLLRGVVVTLLAALIPAWRAIRVPPLAALRDVAIERPASKVRLVIGALIAALAGFLLLPAFTTTDDPDIIPGVAGGFVVLLIAAIVLGPALAGPTARILGLPLRRSRGVTGRLAVENAARSPKRTAATSAALLIGVALVGFITVLGASMREAVTATVSQGVKADVIASSLSGFGPPTGFSPALVDQIGAIDGVETVSAVGFSQVHLEPEGAEPSDTVVFAIDPATVLDVMDPVVVEGDLSTLTPDQIVVDEVVARQNGISVGDSILVVVPGGASRELTVAAVSDDQLLNPYAITQQAFQELVPEALDMLALVDVSGDADVSTVQSAVEDLFRDQPFVQVLDHDAFVGSAADQITGFVNFIYIMLALSVIIALIGVANTLSLSIHERTREIGLLRAIGGARDQIRSSFRWEAAIVSVIGTLVGLGIALLGSYALVRALGAFDLEAFVLPIPQLLAILAGATVLGVLASLLPSRRAARLDILEAIAQS